MKKQTVLKYQIPVEDNFSIELPKGYKILTVQAQSIYVGNMLANPYEETAMLWVLVNPEEKEKETVQFLLAGTGHEIEMEKYPLGMEYINSFQMKDGKLVFHLFFVETISVRAMIKAFGI